MSASTPAPAETVATATERWETLAKERCDSGEVILFRAPGGKRGNTTYKPSARVYFQPLATGLMRGGMTPGMVRDIVSNAESIKAALAVIEPLQPIADVMAQAGVTFQARYVTLRNIVDGKPVNQSVHLGMFDMLRAAAGSRGESITIELPATKEREALTVSGVCVALHHVHGDKTWWVVPAIAAGAAGDYSVSAPVGSDVPPPAFEM